MENNKIAFDASRRPLSIPPEFIVYAEKHHIFDLFEEIVKELVIDKPAEPLDHILNTLQKNKVPQVVVQGPPASGKATLCHKLAQLSGAVHVNVKDLIQSEILHETALGLKAQIFAKNGEAIPDNILVSAVVERLKKRDCLAQGWILQGFPSTRNQALALQMQGVLVGTFLQLVAPDAVLVERFTGRRIDPDTGRIYHVTFDPPTDEEVSERLERVPNDTEENVREQLETFHRNQHGLSACYLHIMKRVNADQPIGDVVTQAWGYMCQAPRSNAPFVPRIVLIGPIGCGKRVQAEHFAKKYGIVHVTSGQLVRQHIASDSPYSTRLDHLVKCHAPIPDAILSEIVIEKLRSKECVTRGWVLDGFPKNKKQAERLMASGCEPNRVFYIDACLNFIDSTFLIIIQTPDEVIRERVAMRRTDPIGGKVYHLLDSPPASEEVLKRLVQNPADSDEAVQQKLDEYKQNSAELAAFFSQSQHVNGDQESHAVFECLESLLVQPLLNNP